MTGLAIAGLVLLGFAMGVFFLVGWAYLDIRRDDRREQQVQAQRAVVLAMAQQRMDAATRETARQMRYSSVPSDDRWQS